MYRSVCVSVCHEGVVAELHNLDVTGRTLQVEAGPLCRHLLRPKTVVILGGDE
jgi:hypothetical protein